MLAHIKLPLVFLRSALVNYLEHMQENPVNDPLIIALIVLLVAYIIGLALSKNTSCIIVCGGDDLFLTALPTLVLVAAVFINTSAFDKETPIPVDNILLNILFMLPVIATLVVSVVANLKYTKGKKAIFYIIISLLAKTMVLLTIALVAAAFIATLLAAYGDKKKDGWYRGGYKPSKYLVALPIIGAIGTFLVGSVVKNPWKRGGTV